MFQNSYTWNSLLNIIQIYFLLMHDIHSKGAPPSLLDL